MPPRPFQRLFLPFDLFAALLAQARAEAPLECCGLLAGRIVQGDGAIEARYPLENEAASPVEFVSDARGTFDAMRDLERRGLEVLAVYHSHPATPPRPSRKDLARNYSESVVNLIVSLRSEPPEVGSWWLWNDGFEAAQLEIGEPGADAPGSRAK